MHSSSAQSTAGLCLTQPEPAVQGDDDQGHTTCRCRSPSAALMGAAASPALSARRGMRGLAPAGTQDRAATFHITSRRFSAFVGTAANAWRAFISEERLSGPLLAPRFLRLGRAR